MQKVIFIHPSFDSGGPRTIRIGNVIQQLNKCQEGIANVFKYENSYEGGMNSTKNFQTINKYNWIHLLFRLCGVYRISGFLSTSAKKIGRYSVSNFLIRWDLISRKAELSNGATVFVVVVSPFTNYLLVPWLKAEFSQARVVIDVGDPLYMNAARNNCDEYSKRIEQNAVSVADTILVTNKSTQEFFANTYLVPYDNIAVVPQGVDVELIESTRPAGKISTPHTLAYAGRFYKGLRWPAALFEAMAQQTTYTLNLYGSGWGKAETNVVEHSKMSQKQLFSELHGNELLVFIDNVHGIQTSGKIYELLAFSKPLLFIKGSERSEVMALAENHVHVIFAENEPDAILAALKKYEEGAVPAAKKPLVEYSWKSRTDMYKKALKI